MMKKSIVLFVAAAVFAVGVTAYGWAFVDSRIGDAVLTEETLAGNREAADGLTVGFRADSADDLHWLSRFAYSTDQSSSTLKMGKMAKTTDASVYKEVCFNGWSAVPYATQLHDGRLAGLQEKDIQAFYQEIEQQVKGTNAEEKGEIRLKDYLDVYPISFRFRFGANNYNSDNALTGLKIYDEQGKLNAETGSGYDEDVALYTAFNDWFRIPVIEDEYQTYRVFGVETYNPKNALSYQTEIKPSLGGGEDYYVFDPIITMQEEGVLDGKSWFHPDLSGDVQSSSHLKNRMLFVVNNRTAKGKAVDVSQIREGYGIYALPIDASATAVIKTGKRYQVAHTPRPLLDEMKMVYALDETAEYVEMSLSEDHRYLALFSVKDDTYFVEMIDADTWASAGTAALFPAAEQMTYAWGADGSLAMTNHQGYVAVLAGNEEESHPYEVIYSGRVENGLDDAFFDREVVQKKNSYAQYQCGMDKGLVVTAKDGKVALVQNLLVGDMQFGIRNAALACAVIDESGVIYNGRLKSNVVDLGYDLSRDELRRIQALRESKDDSKAAKYMIEPVRSENWAKWDED